MLKMPYRTKEIEMDGDYKGFKFTANVSVPMTIFSYLQTGNWTLIQSALSMILISWNFPDSEGNPLPQPGEMTPALDSFGEPVFTAGKDEEGKDITQPIMVPVVGMIPPDLAMKIIEKTSENVISVPNP